MQGDGKPVRRAEVYLRTLCPDGYCQQQSSILDRLAGLEERGYLTERAVQVCGKQVPATLEDTRTDVGEQFVDRVSAFREWAIRNDASLAPGFEVREVDNAFAATRYRAVRLPAILLAEYRDADLLCVTPHHDGTSVHTVSDRVAELEAGEPTRFEPVTRGPPPDDDGRADDDEPELPLP